MEELKQMLEAIHQENKDIILLMCCNDELEKRSVNDVKDEIDKMYDGLLYRKEIENAN